MKLINLEAPPQLAAWKKGDNFKLDGVPKYFSVGRAVDAFVS
jgi:hypothetical protein